MKILIADDHALIRSGLRNELAALDTAVEFVEAWDADSLRQMIERHEDLDLVILDLAMPGMERERTIVALRDAHPSIPLIVLSGADPVADARAVLWAGAAGFIPKSGMSKVMLQAIRLVLAGGQYLPPQLMQVLAIDKASASATAEPATEGATAATQTTPNRPVQRRAGLAKPLDLLSQRQREVFVLLAEGLSNKAIARRLDITEGTVKTHVATIFDVLNVHNRVSAVAAARALAVDDRGNSKGE